jgi:hypothetical protein
VKVGDEVEYTCPRCKHLMPHTILYFREDGCVGAVQCRTCGSQHSYRSYRVGRVRRMPRSKGTLISLVQGGTFQERIARLGSDKPIPYRLDGRYRQEDAIEHARFGIGFVLQVKKDRMHVLFREGIKVLACAPNPKS